MTIPDVVDEEARRVLDKALQLSGEERLSGLSSTHLWEAMATMESRAREVLVDLGWTEDAFTQMDIESTVLPANASKVLELALAEATLLGMNYVGVLTLMLGLLRANDPMATVVMEELSVDLDDVRNRVVRALS